METCQSGLMSLFAKEVFGSNRTEGSNPSVSAYTQTGAMWHLSVYHVEYAEGFEARSDVSAVADTTRAGARR